uniref:Uncharacterized protein n=1 Tax=Magallana gigas TaxID=29159 RepID=A0A8W8N4J0_MAGGI
MNLFQLFFLASCMKIIVLASDSPSEDRGKLSIDKKYTKKYFKKGYLTFDGLIKVVGDAKLFGIACLPNTTVKHEDGRLFIKEFIISCKHFFLRWAPDSRSYDADKFYTLAEASYNAKKRFGEYKAKWESTAEMKDMPIYLKSALESRNIAEKVTSNRFHSIMVMYFILHRCDPIPGRFLCENAVEAHHVSKGKVALLSDFYKPSGEESSPKCPDYKDESKVYLMRYDLVDEYNRKMKESVNSEVLGLAEVAYTADELSEKRKMNIRCRVHPTNASLLVGCQGEMLWTDLYRIRMFPQFENLLKEKDASCTVGHVSKAEMKVNIVLNECDVLSGAFQCAIVVEDRFHKSVIYRGMYELKDTVASKPEPGLECKESKGKSANADASVSLTATGKSRKKGKSAGYRTVPEVGWMMLIWILLFIL